MTAPGNYSRDELEAMGFAALGRDARIHRTVLIFGAAHVRLGSPVRIDAYTVITAGPGEVVFGDYAHIAVGCCIYGGAGVHVDDFGAVAARCSLYSIIDDFSGAALASGPAVPEGYRRIERGPVYVGRHVMVGAGSVIMPGVRLETGSAVGALSLVRESTPPFTLVAGIPARVIGERKRDCVALGESLRRERANESPQDDG